MDTLAKHFHSLPQILKELLNFVKNCFATGNQRPIFSVQGGVVARDGGIKYIISILQGFSWEEGVYFNGH